MTTYTHKPAMFALASGKRIDLNNPRAEDIDVRDICHNLSGIIRFNGALPPRDGSLSGPPVLYTVAEHTLHVAACAMELAHGAPEAYLRDVVHAALLHDAAEAYVGDMTSPMKQALRLLAAIHDGIGFDGKPYDFSGFDHVEFMVNRAIAEHFNFAATDEIAALVKDADVRVYAAECVQLRRWDVADFEGCGGANLHAMRWQGTVHACRPFLVKSLLSYAFLTVRDTTVNPLDLIAMLRHRMKMER